ncbi:MAG: hypothetical protein JNJ49_09070 [Bdellovibrionaceae bacterium]|nr:hypothetical protein [Pseudobdellovibrionaceae bacterium]
MKSLLILTLTFLTSIAAEAARRTPEYNCNVALGKVGMPQGPMAIPREATQALRELGYQITSEYSADLFLWIDADCSLGPIGSICTGRAKLTDLITREVVAEATGVPVAAFMVYSVNAESAVAALPSCEELSRN